MTNILITGYYGLGNIGDEAILSGIINSLKRYVDDAKFFVITNNPNETRDLHNITPISQSYKKGPLQFIKSQIMERELIRVYKAMDNCDIFILGGGELLQDLKVHYLPIFLSLVYLAQKKNKKTVIYGIGAGPIETNFGKTLCKRILNDADLVTVRDSKSKIALENCGVSNVIQTADPAFAIDIPNKNMINENLIKNNLFGSEKVIGITSHNLLYNDDIYRKSGGSKIDLSPRREILATTFDNIIEKYNRRLMFLPTVESDINGYLKIIEFMSNADKTIPIEHNSDFRYFLSLLSISDILIGMRLHSMIIATMLGIPFVPISYSGKVKSFLDLIGLNDLYVDVEDISRQNFSEELSDNFSKVCGNRQHYSKLLLNCSAKSRKKTFENAKLVSDLIGWVNSR
ncbi:MAG: polysaccharide pyruvyl transferase family protein [Thermodesulfobacteriota bacterium]|nr:polysaccharide pyruvyl transferase family protein [Thermodesulfobacteriota bacterium]